MGLPVICFAEQGSSFTVTLSEELTLSEHIPSAVADRSRNWRLMIDEADKVLRYSKFWRRSIKQKFFCFSRTGCVRCREVIFYIRNWSSCGSLVALLFLQPYLYYLMVTFL